MKVRLHDGAFHSVDSSENAFKVAGSMAFKSAVEKAHPVLLEPYVRVEVLTPSELVGDIMGDLSSRRGRPMGVEQRGERQIIQAEVPQIEMLTYARDLRSITGGRANFHVEAGHYEEVPPNLVEKVLAANEGGRESSKLVSTAAAALSAHQPARAGRCSRHVDPDQGVARDKLRKLFLTQVLCVGRAHGRTM